MHAISLSLRALPGVMLAAAPSAVFAQASPPVAVPVAPAVPLARSTSGGPVVATPAPQRPTTVQAVPSGPTYVEPAKQMALPPDPEAGLYQIETIGGTCLGVQPGRAEVSAISPCSRLSQVRLVLQAPYRPGSTTKEYTLEFLALPGGCAVPDFDAGTRRTDSVASGTITQWVAPVVVRPCDTRPGPFRFLFGLRGDRYIMLQFNTGCFRVQGATLTNRGEGSRLELNSCGNTPEHLFRLLKMR